MTETSGAWCQREGLALLTDFYELTMMAGYLKEGRADQEVTFDYSFRSLPPHAGFAVAAGLETFLQYLDHLRFHADDVAYLDSLAMFEKEVVGWGGLAREASARSATFLKVSVPPVQDKPAPPSAGRWGMDASRN